MNDIKITGFESLKSIEEDAAKKGLDSASKDIGKSKKQLLEELHQTANLSAYVTDSISVLAHTIAKNASLQVKLSDDAEKIQKAIKFLAWVTMGLAAMQLITAAYNIFSNR